MKKYINIAFIYGILGICGGVFYREFTKFMDFVDMRTQLAFLHVHLFVFGMIMFLLVAVFEKLLNISESKKMKSFMIFYNLGLCWSVAVMAVRGVMQVVGFDGGAAVSGIAGIGHILITVGLVLFFLILKERSSNS